MIRPVAIGREPWPEVAIALAVSAILRTGYAGRGIGALTPKARLAKFRACGIPHAFSIRD